MAMTFDSRFRILSCQQTYTEQQIAIIDLNWGASLHTPDQTSLVWAKLEWSNQKLTSSCEPMGVHSPVQWLCSPQMTPETLVKERERLCVTLACLSVCHQLEHASVNAPQQHYTTALKESCFQIQHNLSLVTLIFSRHSQFDRSCFVELEVW